MGQSTPDQLDENGAATVSRYSIFSLSDMLFGIEIESVKEVLKYPSITNLPNVDLHILGVFNLRGTIVSLVDLRYTLSLEVQDIKNTDMILLVEMNEMLIGILVEKVLDFVDVENLEIQIPSRSISSSIANYIKGSYEKEELGKIFLLDLEKLLKSSEIFKYF